VFKRREQLISEHLCIQASRTADIGTPVYSSVKNSWYRNTCVFKRQEQLISEHLCIQASRNVDIETTVYSSVHTFTVIYVQLLQNHSLNDLVVIMYIFS
jgi:hypothetical protein